MDANLIFVLLLSLFVRSGANCPDGFTPWHEGYCFMVDDGNSQGGATVPWQTAVDRCRQKGGELASVHSDLQNTRIVQAANVAMTKPGGWLGLHCSGGNLQWTDGTPVDYTHGSVPCNSYGVYLDPNMSWRAENLNADYYCQHKKRNGDGCLDFGGVNTNGTCVSVRTDVQSWNNAEKLCKKDGGHLISIHDEDIDHALASLISKVPGANGGFHIGMQTNTAKGETFAWSDGSFLDYLNFARGFPSDSFGHCTAMETIPTPGRWITTQCDTSGLPYICSKPAPEPIAPAGCPINPYFEGDNVTVYSPSYPTSSGALSCDYFLIVPTGKRVHLNIDDLNTNLCCDKLMLYDGFATSTPMATLSGKPNGQNYTSTGVALKMTYQSTDGTHVRGWKVTFTAV